MIAITMNSYIKFTFSSFNNSWSSIWLSFHTHQCSGNSSAIASIVVIFAPVCYHNRSTTISFTFIWSKTVLDYTMWHIKRNDESQPQQQHRKKKQNRNAKIYLQFFQYSFAKTEIAHKSLTIIIHETKIFRMLRMFEQMKQSQNKEKRKFELTSPDNYSQPNFCLFAKYCSLFSFVFSSICCGDARSTQFTAQNELRCRTNK